MRRRPLPPDHDHLRGTLRRLGAATTLGGVVLTAIGAVSFVGAIGGGEPRLFWCAFVGLPLAGLGVTLLRLGYLGAAARYVAGEAAPAVADAIAHVAEHARAAAHAAAAGQADRPLPRRCAACGADAGHGARFCNQCGASLPDDVACPRCRLANAPPARFCAGCGHELAVF